jgi:hypothetical protein
MKDSDLISLFDSTPDLTESEKSLLLHLMQKYVQRAFGIASGFVQYKGEQQVTDTHLILALKAQALEHFYQGDTKSVNGCHQDPLCESPTDQEQRAYNEMLIAKQKWDNWDPDTFPHTLIKMAIDKTELSLENDN